MNKRIVKIYFFQSCISFTYLVLLLCLLIAGMNKDKHAESFYLKKEHQHKKGMKKYKVGIFPCRATSYILVMD